MNLTNDLVDEFRRLAREYDGASTIESRIALGAKIDEFGERLSERQIVPFLKMVMRQ